MPALAKEHVLLLLNGRFVASTYTDRYGKFSFRRRVSAPGPYTARFGEATSPEVFMTVKPRLEAKLVGSGARGSLPTSTRRA